MSTLLLFLLILAAMIYDVRKAEPAEGPQRQFFSVTIFYGPPAALTVYVNRLSVDAADVDALVRPSLCAALQNEPEVELPVAYEVVELVRDGGGREVPGQILRRAMLSDCPPTGGMPA